MAYQGVPTIFFDNGVTLTRDVLLLDTNFNYVSGKWVSVMDASFGAKGDGVTNDLIAIQAAIDFVYGLGGGTVYVPAGLYLVGGSIRYKANVSLIGAGRGATTIKLMNSSGLTGAHGIVEPYFVGSLPTIGYWTKNNTLAHFSVDGNQANNVGMFYECVAGYQAKDLLVFDVEAFGATETGFQGQVTNVGTDQNSLISFVSCVSHDNLSDGFQVGGASIVNCWSYNNGGSGFDSVGNFVSGNTDNVVTTISNCRAQNNTNGGITTILQTGPQIRTVISGCACLHNGNNGVYAGMNNTEISNCDTSFNKQDGLSIQANYCVVTGGQSTNNGQSLAGYQSGLLINGNVNYVTVNGVLLTDNQSVKTQQFAFAFTGAGGGSNNLLAGCQCAGNVQAIPYQMAGATDWIIRNNPGVNPFGPFGNTTIHANPAVPATTAPLTNTYSFPCLVTVAGGTVTVIAINGTATGLTSGSFVVGPGETIAITYTGVPTWQWYGL